MEAKVFGQFLRTLRKNKKLTIRQLELYSGVSNAYLSQIENGNRGIPSPDILKKLHSHLDVDYNDLMRTAGYLEDESYGTTKENADEFVQSLELTDEELMEKFNFTFKGEEISADTIKKILSYARFVANEEK